MKSQHTILFFFENKPFLNFKHTKISFLNCSLLKEITGNFIQKYVVCVAIMHSRTELSVDFKRISLYQCQAEDNDYFSPKRTTIILDFCNYLFLKRFFINFIWLFGFFLGIMNFIVSIQSIVHYM